MYYDSSLESTSIDSDTPNGDGTVACWKPRQTSLSDAKSYNMQHPCRGKAVVFNHETFRSDRVCYPVSGIPSYRSGEDVDALRLEICLESLGFQVQLYTDLNKSQFFEILHQLQNEDHSSRDCLLVVLMTHGGKDKLFTSDSRCYKPEQLWDPYTADKCTGLAGKPKIFFIQACRGNKLDPGTYVEAEKGLRGFRSRGAREEEQIVSPENGYVVPNLADFLVVYSCAKGYYSWRDPEEGSWFIQSLTEVLQTFGDKKDLLSMLTFVTRKVAMDFETTVSKNPKHDGMRQVPQITSTLTKDIYFVKKQDSHCPSKELDKRKVTESRSILNKRF